VGDRIEIQGANFSYFQGGGGWGVTRAALDQIVGGWAVWENILLTGGESPVSPGFTAVTTYADDLLFGIFMASLGIPALKLEGWSGAPVDVKGGVVPCRDEIKRSFCFSQAFSVGTWADGEVTRLSR
jgi:hypothetical protein